MMTSIPHLSSSHRQPTGNATLAYRPGPSSGAAAALARHRIDWPMLLFCCALGPIANGHASAQQSGSSAVAGQEWQRQQQRERALRDQKERSPDVRLPAEASGADAPGDAAQRLPHDETPCFAIERIVIDGGADFAWAIAAVDRDGLGRPDAASDRCLGSIGVNRVMRRVQNAIIARGYITTRVVAQEQDLRAGVLVLTIVPGRIGAIRFSADSDARANAASAFPAKPGDLLNLRDIEQALENFKRLPSVDADIEIVAGEEAGDSDIVIRWRQAFPLRLTLAADDGGLPTTGRYLGSITLSADHPLGINDLFYASFNHDLGGGQEGERGTQGYTVHYSLPWGYWQLAATASANRYHQSVAGLTQSYLYSGRSETNEIRLSRLLARDATSRSWASLRGYLNTSNNSIDDTEIEVQRRRMAGWEAAVDHRAFVAAATIDLHLAYRRGTGAFAALPAPEEAFGEGTARPTIVSAEAQVDLPFHFADQSLRYTGRWRAQWNRTPLVPQDRFSIGGRYTVRGFDGDSVLMAERGWLLRNEVALAFAAGHELYAGIDCGAVGGASSGLLVGKRLCGSVIGLRGSHRQLSYDIFAGVPLDKPDGFETARVAAGFSLTLGF